MTTNVLDEIKVALSNFIVMTFPKQNSAPDAPPPSKNQILPFETLGLHN